MRPAKYYTQNEKVGNCIFVREVDKIGHKRKAIFICPKCNNEYISQISNVLRGVSSSCGCTRMSKMREAALKHGATVNYGRMPEYNAWSSMKQRCYRASHPSYKNYGARGIVVCNEWLNSFDNFLLDLDMGCRPSKEYSLERKENDKGYNKENCKWAIKKEQLMNRRNTKLITYNGKTQGINDWARELGLKISSLDRRVRVQNMSFEKAITTPLQDKPTNSVKLSDTRNGAFYPSIMDACKILKCGVRKIRSLIKNNIIKKQAELFQ